MSCTSTPKVYFLEELPLIHLPVGCKVLALTANVCCQLDEKYVKYEIPQDYVYPKQLSELAIKEIKDKISNDEKVFIEYHLSMFESLDYWGEFLKSYLEKNNIGYIIYYGNEAKNLIDLLKKLFQEVTGVTKKDFKVFIAK